MLLQSSLLNHQRYPEGAPGTGGSSPFGAASNSVTTTGNPILPLLASAVDSGRQAVQQAASPLRVEAATGAASLSIPIYVSPGRDPTTTPSLELTYSSHAANGPFGLGWSLTVPCISRKTTRAVPRYSDQDVFVLSGAEDLVRLDGSAAINTAGYLVHQYKPRVLVGPSQARIERWINPSDPADDFWRTISSTGLTTLYGKSLEDRIHNPEDPQRTFTWLISATYDLKGNCCVYRHKAEDSTNIDLSCAHEQNRSTLSRTAGRYLKSIHYGNRKPNRDLETWAALPIPMNASEYLFTVILDYGEHNQQLPQPSGETPWTVRADPFSSSAGGFEVRMYRLCRRVLVFHNFIEKDVKDCLVSSTAFAYQEAPTGSTLVAINRHGHRRVSDGRAGYRYTDERLPAFQMEYKDGERLQPVAVDASQFPDLPHAHPQQRTQWLDLNGEGSPGLLAQLASGEWVYMRNESSRDPDSAAAFSPPRRLQNVPNSLLNPSGFFASLTDDGSLQFVDRDGRNNRLQGYSERNTAEGSGWGPWVLFPSVPSELDDNGLDTYSIDLAGSGRQDRAHFMQDSSGQLRWYPSLGTDGFAPARIHSGPLIPRDERGTAAILLADMTGDGLTDVVHVRAGEIVYWPNLGHGQFGTCVRMDNAPILASYDEFNVSQVRLMDVDGSGCADLVYFIPGGGAAIYFNQSGNGWSEAVSLSVVPDMSLLASIEVVDILGRGLPCICWTLTQTTGAGSPRLYYLELMGEMKPWLLTEYSNGVGAKVSLEYQPSTHFYLQDEGTSQAWNTRLPFPVICVATQTTDDQVAETKQVTRYAYHDGFYDRTEREFRGFGLVDIWDSEDLSAGPGLKRLEAPPRHLRTWYHTGAPVSALETSFGHGDLSVPQLVPFHLPENAASPSEVRESLRALKGKILRSETYPDGRSREERTPLAVTQHNYTILMEQEIEDTNENRKTTDLDMVVYEQPHGRFRVLPRESLQVSYEANNDLQDAQMEHQMYLETNEYGQCTKQVTVQYGRLDPPQDLDEDTRATQQETIVHYTESNLTNAIDEDDFFSLPTTAEEKGYRMRGLSAPELPSLLFSFEAFSANGCALFKAATETPYERDRDPVVSPEVYKVLTSNTRSYYWNSDLTSRLKLGQIEAYSVLDRTYQLAVTSGLMLQVFGTNDDSTSLRTGWSAQDGAYADLDDNGSWWIPSQQSRFCFPAAADDADTELLQARSHFYLPRFTIDPYRNVGEEEVDQYCLLRVRSTDGVGNTESYQPDFTSLQPVILTNSNENRVLIAYDGFGAPIGAAVQGKVGEGLGDTLDDFSTTVSREDMLSFYADPVKSAAKLLGSTSWRRIYNREWTSEMPAFEAELRRDQHLSSPSPAQISVSISYLDGRGNKIQSLTLHSDESTVKWRREGWSICSTMAKSSVLTFVPSLESSHRYSKRSDLAPENFPPSSVTVYDALNRAAATLHPDHTWQVTTIGAWTVKQRDGGDNVLVEDMAADREVGALISASMDGNRYLPTWYATHSASTASAQDQAAAEKSKVYSNTPDLHHLDIAGNAAAAFDALGREVTRSQRDLCGRTLYESSMDSGPSWSCPDALGRRWLTWTVRPDDVKGKNRMRMGYDEIGRLTHVWLQEGLSSSTPERLIVQHEYGESQSNATKRNLHRQHYRTWDQAGLYTSTAYDFKRNCISRQTTFAQDYKGIIDWSLTGQDRPALEETVHAEEAEYDACNRALRVAGVDGSITQNIYNVAGFLQTLLLTKRASPETTETYLENVSYNAMGQRELVMYGNGVQIRHDYDPLTQLEVHKKTLTKSGAVLRDLQYTHDCAGQQVYREDAAQQNTYFRNSIVRPVNDYTYDARGQLIKATGREQVDAQGSSLTPYGPRYKGQQTIPGDGRQMCQYTESLQYDGAGNISSLTHDSGDRRISGWKRVYSYDEASCLTDSVSGVKNNRLSWTTVRGAQENYTYDNRGCMTSMPGTVKASWDHLAQLRVSTSQRVREGTPETTWYVYNASGDRVRKVTERASATEEDATKLRETYTLAGFSGYEIYREYSGQGAVESEKKMVQVSDGDSTPLALVEDVVTGLNGSASASQSLLLVRYQLDDGLEVDDLGQVISLEEYSPFGSTTYRATRSDVDAPAKYRFSGYPRDTQDTGLYHCGVRYYAAWIGQWTSPDPLGVLDGLNGYCYVGNDPVNKVDTQGT
ncbi:virulence plasmid 65kDa B protein-domain-containing protein, partial [Talaromyces proteolyticus]